MISARPRVHACPLHLVIHLGGGGRTRFSSVPSLLRPQEVHPQRRRRRRRRGMKAAPRRAKPLATLALVVLCRSLGHEKGYRAAAVEFAALRRSERERGGQTFGVPVANVLTNVM